jgi:hypothetical protein
MGPLIYVIAIMGCGESDAQCREVAVAPATYASPAACAAATVEVLGRYSDLAYPSVVAQCRPAGPRPATLRGTQVLLPAPQVAPPMRYAAAGGIRS